MSEINQATKELETHLRTKCGEDLKLIVARHKAFGNADNCLLVYGVGAVLAVEILKAATPGAAYEEQQGGGFRGSPEYTYFAFSFT